MSAGDTPDRPEIFVIPREGDRFYLYAPLRRRLAVVNRAAVRAVARALDGLNPEPGTDALLARLQAEGLLGGSEPRMPRAPREYAFRPIEVTLFPTSRCNLRCRYCYADAGRKSVDMAWPVAEAAIELVARNAGLLGSSRFGVGFHGGGEPLSAWELVERAVAHARRRADDLGLRADVYAATNGLLSPARRKMVAKSFTSVSVSLDGPPDVQDHNRPRVSGRGSYATVRSTLKYFDDVGFQYGIRATVTRGTVARLVEIVEHLHAEFRFSWLHVEPVWDCGRCATTGEVPPTHQAFAEHFKAAAARGRELGVTLHYSGARLDTLTAKYCGAPGEGFSVLPEGVVTSCYEVTEVSDPRATTFHYGRYDPTTSAFVFDERRLMALRGLSVDAFGFCGDCFARWHCAGDCLSKVFEQSGGPIHEGSPRCGLNRALTTAALDDLVIGACKEVDGVYARAP